MEFAAAVSVLLRFPRRVGGRGAQGPTRGIRPLPAVSGSCPAGTNTGPAVPGHLRVGAARLGRDGPRLVDLVSHGAADSRTGDYPADTANSALERHLYRVGIAGGPGYLAHRRRRAV